MKKYIESIFYVLAKDVISTVGRNLKKFNGNC